MPRLLLRLYLYGTALVKGKTSSPFQHFTPLASVSFARVSMRSVRSLSWWSAGRKRDPSKLFEDAEKNFPARWRGDGWYLTTVAALIGSRQQYLVGPLYQHLLTTEQFQTTESRKRLTRRLREAMIKCIILNGIPIVMEAFQSLAKVEQPEDQDHSFTREGWKPNMENYRRGMTVLETLYKDENEKIWATFGAHKDIPWISVAISYGLFLADHTILNIQESELVILPAILCQNLEGATKWHFRGCLRVGMVKNEVDDVQKVTEAILRFGGREIPQVGSVWDIEDDT